VARAERSMGPGQGVAEAVTRAEQVARAGKDRAGDQGREGQSR